MTRFPQVYEGRDADDDDNDQHEGSEWRYLYIYIFTTEYNMYKHLAPSIKIQRSI